MAKINIAADFETLLPKHTDEELKQLEENCLADPDHKQMPPILVWTHQNTIIDGHNQYRFRTKHGLKCRFHRMPFQSRQDALLHAINVQIGRRNLTPSQLSMVAAKFPKLTHGGDRKSRVTETADSEIPPKNKGKNQEANLPLEKRAEITGVSGRSIKHADKVTDQGAAELVTAVQDGTVKVSDAAAVVDLSIRDQKAALSQVKKGDAKTLKEAAELLKQPARQSIVLDSLERQVPKKLIEKHAAAAPIKSAASQLDGIRRTVETLAEKPGGEFIPLSEVQDLFKCVKGKIVQSRYWTECPRCKGSTKKTCDRCEGHGYIPHYKRGMLSTEDKEWLGL